MVFDGIEQRSRLVFEPAGFLSFLPPCYQKKSSAGGVHVARSAGCTATTFAAVLRTYEVHVFGC